MPAKIVAKKLTLSKADAALDALVEARVAKMEPAMTRAYFKAVRTLQEYMTQPELLRRLASGVPSDIILSARVLDGAFVPMADEVENALQHSFKITLKDLPKSAARLSPTGEVAIRFDRRAPYVERAVQALETQLLRKLKDEVRETVRKAIQIGIEDGVHPTAVARGVRDVIGLYPQQVQAARNYGKAIEAQDWAKAKTYDNRDRRFDKWLAGDRVVAPEKITEMVNAYKRRALITHSETITKTATLNAYRQGQRASIDGAIADGVLPAGRMDKTWVTVGDSRVRLSHQQMRGETVPYDQTFSNGQDVPNEYNCRCKVRYTLRPLSQARGALRGAR